MSYGGFEYIDGLVEWVWEDVVLAGVSDCVLSYRGVPAYGGGEVCIVLGDVCMCGRVGCENGLLEMLEPI